MCPPNHSLMEMKICLLVVSFLFNNDYKYYE